MPFDFKQNDGGRKDWGRWPKVGESITLGLVKVEKREFDDSKLKYPVNFKKADGTNLGFHYEVTGDDGKTYTLGNWSLLYAFRDNKVDEGCKIKLDHTGRGEWAITHIKQEEAEVSWDD